MYLILQQDKPDDYVIATGITTSVREFIQKAFAEIGLELKFSGEGEKECASVVSLDEKRFTEKVGALFLPPIRKKNHLESFGGSSGSRLLQAQRGGPADRKLRESPEATGLATSFLKSSRLKSSSIWCQFIKL